MVMVKIYPKGRNGHKKPALELDKATVAFLNNGVLRIAVHKDLAKKLHEVQNG